MNNRIILSTGTFIGPENGYDYRLIPAYSDRFECDAFELMMLKAWYPCLSDVQRYLSRSNVRFDIVHSEKDIGTLLSLGGEEDTREAERIFELSCRTGEVVGAKKLVLHLWGGRATDAHIDYNISRLGRLVEIAAGHGLDVMTENVPCGVHDPLSNWTRLLDAYPNASLIFDTRFGAFHGQLDKIFDDGWFERGNIRHIHVSDFAGQPGQFNRLRPIPMPAEGTIGGEGFDRFFSRLKLVYNGTVTLESPATNDNGSVGVETINRALRLIRGYKHESLYG